MTDAEEFEDKLRSIAKESPRYFAPSSPSPWPGWRTKQSRPSR